MKWIYRKEQLAAIWVDRFLIIPFADLQTWIYSRFFKNLGFDVASVQKYFIILILNTYILTLHKRKYNIHLQKMSDEVD